MNDDGKKTVVNVPIVVNQPAVNVSPPNITVNNTGITPAQLQQLTSALTSSSSGSGSGGGGGAGSGNYVVRCIDGFILKTLAQTDIDRNRGGQALSIDQGQASDHTYAMYLATSQKYYKTLAATFTPGPATAGAPSGFLDTGSVAPNTWYHVYAIGATNKSTTDFIASVNSPGIGPNLPSGYIYWRLIMSILTSASSNIISFQQNADYIQWDTCWPDIGGSGGGLSLVSDTPTLLTLPSIPPDISVMTDLRSVISGDSGATAQMGFQPGNENTTGQNWLYYSVADTATTGAGGLGQIMSNISQQIIVTIIGSNPVVWIGVNGWTHPRGRTQT